MSRNAVFGVIVAVCFGVAFSYVGLAARARGQQVETVPPGPLMEQFTASLTVTPASAPATVASPAAVAPSTTPTAAAGAPMPGATAGPSPTATQAAPVQPTSTARYVVFLDGTNPLAPRVALASLDNPDGPREVTSLRCRRVYFGAGAGVCLATEGLLEHGVLKILDGRLQPTAQFDTPGLPSRARVSSSGRYAAATVFVAGDSYNETGFSTRTQFIDIAARSPLYDLEQTTVIRNGSELSHIDFNFWGVTFASDGDRYYATLGTQGTTYLIEGSISRRTARVLLEGIECPSLSLDETRVAFKHLVGRGKNTAFWQVSVLDLRTMQTQRVISEARSVDDQIEWLDNEQLLYGLVRPESEGFGYDIWALRADGASPARMFIRNASSPAVVRGVAPQAAP